MGVVRLVSGCRLAVALPRPVGVVVGRPLLPAPCSVVPEVRAPGLALLVAVGLGPACGRPPPGHPPLARSAAAGVLLADPVSFVGPLA